MANLAVYAPLEMRLGRTHGGMAAFQTELATPNQARFGIYATNSLCNLKGAIFGSQRSLTTS